MEAEENSGAVPGQGYQEDIKAMRNLLISKYRESYQAVPILPWVKGSGEDLYVPLQLYVKDKKANQEKLLEKLYDLFFSYGTQCKDIFITGNAGIGKSTYCKHLVGLWSQAHECSDEANLSEDAIVMKQFSLCFYLRLTGVSFDTQKSDVDQLKALIQGQIHPSFNNVDLLNLESTLILFDGLDEINTTDILQRGISNKSTIITTSRPWKFHSLQSSPVFKIEQHAFIEGLNHIEGNQLALKYLRMLLQRPISNDDKELTEFIFDVENKGITHSYIWNNPGVLLKVLELWCKDRTLRLTLWEISSLTIHVSLKKTRTLPTKTSKTDIHFPFYCEHQDCICKQYGEVLRKIAKVAFNSLFLKDVPRLVFSESDCYAASMTRQEIKESLEMGIFIYYRSMVVRSSEYMTFQHRSVHEYFAAVYLSYKLQKSNSLNLLEEVIPDLNTVLSLENVLILLVGSRPSLGRQISEFLMKKATGDERIQRYRIPKCQWDELHIVKSVQNIILAASYECRQSDKESLQLKDIYLNDKNEEKITNLFPTLDLTQAQTWLMHNGLAIEKLKDRLVKLNHLQKLFIDYCIVPKDLLVKMISPCLSVLEMWDVKLPQDALEQFMNTVSETDQLREITLCHLSQGDTLEDYRTCNFNLDLSRHLRLERLVIRGSCIISKLCLSKNMEQLKEIRLVGGVKVTAQCIKNMFASLPEHPLIQVLEITIADQ